MSDDSNLPIALRRTRRSTSMVPNPLTSAILSTPKKCRPKKRVRFSDPGAILSALDDELSTGLTPIIRRASLSVLSKSPRRRSTGTPSRLSHASSNGSGLELDQDVLSSPCTEIRILPLRQVLDGRVKRRIRRNGLSEEMNTIYAERKRRSQDTKAEIERLKAELAEKDDEIHRMRDETLVLDTERVWELERQVASLKRELANQSGVQRRQEETPSSPAFDWSTAARDPFSDDFMDLDENDIVDDDDDQHFGDMTMADLACSTPSRRGRTSMPTPPATSPAIAAMPMTPCSHRKRTAISTPTSHHAGVQASLPDPEKDQLEKDRQDLQDELASLQLEIAKLTTTLESYSSLSTRLSAKLSPFPPLDSSSPTTTTTPTAPEQLPNPDLESRLSSLLLTLSDRTAALLHLSTSLSTLGFPGTDAAEIILSLSRTFRTARLELEYLTPGEITLPLTSAGAAVLDLLLSRLRELAKKNREADDAIDEYHAIELSLRQQLGARVTAMDELRGELAGRDGQLEDRDGRIAELEVGTERLKGAVRSYTRDVGELEVLVQALEGEIEERKEEGGRTAGKMAELERKLQAAVERTEGLRGQLAGYEAKMEIMKGEHGEEVKRMNRAHGQALALRDARVAELRGEVERVNGSLRAAHEMVRVLRVENGRLEGEVEGDRRRAKEVIDSMKAELERVVRMSEGFLLEGGMTPKKKSEDGDGDEEGPGSPSRLVLSSGGLLSGELAKKGKSVGGGSAGRKRRRYDSGLGFLDEDEDEVDTLA
ncbi:hypothetical protein B0T17DRAFT_500723 [Bombardia bombarda]|uniref:Uncharacterized protein n=1 Tax=Bombardia bombarda TaxID=252184 RepID=A0AA39U332_9PEZI|nr:hypothetical protein B0T17DRAFT_500723 [Bombardia bombarda]